MTFFPTTSSKPYPQPSSSFQLDEWEMALNQEENCWIAKAQKMAPFDADKLLKQVRSGIKRIRDHIVQMKVLGSSADDIRQMVKRSRDELHALVKPFEKGCDLYEKNKQIVNQRFHDSDEKINRMNFSFAPIVKKPEKVEPNNPFLKKLVDEEMREATIEKMIDARVVVAAGEPMAYVISKGAKAICSSHPQVKKVCHQIKGVVQSLKDSVPEEMKKNYRDNLSFEIKNNQRLGISKEMTSQYQQDREGIAIGSAIGAGGIILKGAFKGIAKASTKAKNTFRQCKGTKGYSQGFASNDNHGMPGVNVIVHGNGNLIRANIDMGKNSNKLKEKVAFLLGYKNKIKADKLEVWVNEGGRSFNFLEFNEISSPSNNLWINPNSYENLMKIGFFPANLSRNRSLNLVSKQSEYSEQIENESIEKSINVVGQKTDRVYRTMKSFLKDDKGGIKNPLITHKEGFSKTIEKNKSTKKEPLNTIKIEDLKVSYEPVAIKVNAISEGTIHIPTVEKLLNANTRELHFIWDENNKTLSGILSKEGVPSSVGLFGADRRTFTKILEEKTSSLNPAQEAISAAGIRYSGSNSLDPMTSLADLYTISILSERRMNNSGGRFIVDISSGKWMDKPISSPHILHLLKEDDLKHKAFLDLIGRVHVFNAEEKILRQRTPYISASEIPNTDIFNLQITPHNYESVVKGVIPIEQTILSIKGRVPPLNSATHPRTILMQRFKHQEVIIEIFEQLKVFDIENAPWQTYLKEGKRLMSNQELNTKIPTRRFQEIHKQFFINYQKETSLPTYLSETAGSSKTLKYPKQGDIYWVDLDPALGMEMGKKRPCVVTSVVQEGNPLVTVAPITSKSKLFPVDVIYEIDGKPGKIKVDHSRAIDISRLIHKIGEVDSFTLEAIHRARSEVFDPPSNSSIISEVKIAIPSESISNVNFPIKPLQQPQRPLVLEQGDLSFISQVFAGQVQNALIVNKVTKIAMESFGRKDSFGQLSSFLKSFPESGFFRTTSISSEKIQSHRNSHLVVKKIEEVLDPVEFGRSGSKVFMVQHPQKEMPFVIKAFASPEQFVMELVATKTYHLMNLKNSGFPQIVALGKHLNKRGEERGMIAMNRVPGDSMSLMIKMAGKLQPGSEARSLSIHKLEGSSEMIADFLAELHEKSIPYKTAPSPSYLSKEIDQLNKRWRIAKELGVKLDIGDRDIEKIVLGMKQNPGIGGFVHGDVHPGNFFIDSKRLYAIDLQALARSIDQYGNPIGVFAKDYEQVLTSFRSYGVSNGLSTLEIDGIIRCFEERYHLKFSGSQTKASKLFYKLFWSLDTLIKSKNNAKVFEVFEKMSYHEFSSID